MTRLEQIKALIADDPHDAMLRFALGNEHFQLEQYAEAIEALKGAIEIDPEYAFVYIQLAEAYEKSGRTATGLASSGISAGMPRLLVSADSGCFSEMRYSIRSVNSSFDIPAYNPSGMSEIALPRCSLISAVAMWIRLPSPPISSSPSDVVSLMTP